MATPASGPGLLYVNSKITSSELSAELFTKWYQDIHIRDIFQTSGINAAFRYITQVAKVERPYLALYPLRDLAFLTSDEFRAIPVVSEMLPAGAQDIFDLADFDTRYYISLGDNREAEVESQGADTYLTTVQFDLPASVDGSDDAKVAAWYRSQNRSVQSSSIRLYKLHFQRQNRRPPEESTLEKPPAMLALHEFIDEGTASAFGLSVKKSERVAPFKLLRDFHKGKGGQ
ncbi:uncharacterized protein AB675_10364 [Cyphellophora attinorum]|uniref:EthD domain-containing protein n=1 Tax=Cyphellophora attinorum TaxID=1664694 RepID=A0A0N0NJT2_9EURO|nr:uncharacterized protein AB675_10364 [Phialophora attinorum]KPI37341.1 hypothetical protein AB675_10364 [Phialophora attinorum]